MNAKIKKLIYAYLRASDLAAWEGATEAEERDEITTWDALEEAWKEADRGSDDMLATYVRRVEIDENWETNKEIDINKLGGTF